MPKVKVGDINMYYEVHGNGEPLVFINGCRMCMDLLYRHVPVFSRDYRVIVFDNRGAGRSDAPDIHYSLEMMAEDLAGLLNAIEIDKAHFIGYSMGGRIAEEVALNYPERVNSLILVGPVTWSAEISWQPDPEAVKESMRQETPSPDASARAFFHRVVSEEFMEKNPALAEKMIKIITDGFGPPHGQKWHLFASASYDNYSRLPEIKAPTLIMAGSADKVVPLDNIHILKERITGAELVVMEKMGHFMMWEAFDGSNRIMLDFLKRHRTKASS